MNIYVQDGQKYIYLTQEELEELEWDEYRLLELSRENSLTRGETVSYTHLTLPTNREV